MNQASLQKVDQSNAIQPLAQTPLAYTLQELKCFFNIPLALKIAKGLVYLGGAVIILATISSLASGHWEILSKFLELAFKAIVEIVGFGTPYFLGLVTASLAVLWLPIVIYILISIFTTSRWGRFYLCLVALCVFILSIKATVFTDISLSSIPALLIYLTQIYLFLLWAIPREAWNFAGGFLWFLQSVVVTVLPDFPTYFDDLGIITAIFVFIFLYLHTMASLLQRIVDSWIVVAVHSGLAGFFKRYLDKTSS